MDTLFLAVWAVVPVLLSLLLATRLWGKPTVLKWWGEMWWQLKKSVINLTRRTVAAIRVFLADEIDEDAALDELEERVAHRLHGRLTAIDNKIHHMREKQTALEKHAFGVLSEGDE
jgi:hypothetical protein